MSWSKTTGNTTNNRFSKSQDRSSIKRTTPSSIFDQNDSLFDWKRAAIQQAGIYISKYLSSVDASFKGNPLLILTTTYNPYFVNIDVAALRENEESVIKLTDF